MTAPLLLYAVVYAVALATPLWLLPIAAIFLGAVFLSAGFQEFGVVLLGLLVGLAARGVLYKYDITWRRAWPVIVVALLLGVPLVFAMVDPQYRYFAP